MRATFYRMGSHMSTPSKDNGTASLDTVIKHRGRAIVEPQGEDQGTKHAMIAVIWRFPTGWLVNRGASEKRTFRLERPSAPVRRLKVTLPRQA